MQLADLDQAAAFLAPVFALPAQRHISWLSGASAASVSFSPSAAGALADADDGAL